VSLSSKNNLNNFRINCSEKCNRTLSISSHYTNTHAHEAGPLLLLLLLHSIRQFAKEHFKERDSEAVIWGEKRKRNNETVCFLVCAYAFTLYLYASINWQIVIVLLYHIMFIFLIHEWSERERFVVRGRQ
jgi:hypothetical protein